MWIPDLQRPGAGSRAASASPRGTCAEAARPGAALHFLRLWVFLISKGEDCARHLRGKERILPATQSKEAPTGEEQGALPASLWPDLPTPPARSLGSPSDMPCPLQEKGVRSVSPPSDFSWVPKPPQPTKDGCVFQS